MVPTTQVFISNGFIRRYNPQTRIPRTILPIGRWVNVREHFAIETAQGLVLYGVMTPSSKGLKSHRVFFGQGIVIVKS